MRQSSMLLPKGTQVAQFEVLDDLGSGGMGHVWLARDQRLGRTVALKTLRQDFPDPHEAVARFRNEARAASSLNHPAIVHIYDIGETTPLLPDGRPSPFGPILYIAMEHVRGETLRKRIERVDFDTTQFIDWIAQVADGVSRAHDAGILHRDLKPENVMVTPDGFVKILDFGLAKLIASPAAQSGTDTPTASYLTGTGVACGTAQYMSPEQLSGKPPTPASDLFALGCMLFEGLTGKNPFARPSIVETIHAIVYEKPAKAEPAGEVEARLHDVALRCLEKKPEDRYGSARELAADLRNAATSSQRVWLARHRSSSWRMPAIAAVVLLVLVAITIVVRLKTSAPAEAPSTTAARAAIASVAVLPFANKAGDSEIEYLSDGITEAIIYDLSQSKSLRVVPRTSVFRLKGKTLTPTEAAKTLGVGAVVVGEVTQHAGELIVHAELIDGSNGSLLWGRRLENPGADLVSVRDEITTEVRNALHAQDPPAAKATTADEEAFRLYLRGRYFWNKRTADGLRRAVEQFTAAIDADPAYAQAWVGLGDSYALLEQYAGIPSRENCSKAKSAVLRAQQLDPSLAEAYASLGLLYGHCEWNWVASEASFQKAIEQNPNYATAHHWYALHLTYRRQFEKARAEAKRAQELDPLSLIALNATSVVEGGAGNWPIVAERSDRILEMDPNFPVAHMWKGRALRAEEKLDEAIAEFTRGLELTGGRSLELIGELGSTYALAGRESDARSLARKLREEANAGRAGSYPLAAIHASLGERDAALRSLTRAFDDHEWFLVQLDVDPLFAPLRGSDSFTRMLEQANLAPPRTR
ncbi:MAG: protein kinase domain-containing protein [Thermoanaerobaculia bacterium]